MRNVAKLAAIALFGVVSFLVVRELRDAGHVAAQPEAVATPPAGPICGKRLTKHRQPIESYCLKTPLAELWYVPLLQADEKKPRVELTLAGIRIGPNISRTGGPCVGVAPGSQGTGLVPEAATKGTALEISPKYLASRTEIQWTLAGTCSGTLANVETEMFVHPDYDLGRFGGSLNIFRFRGDPQFTVSFPSDRLSVGTIRGRPAILGRPLSDSGFGESAVIILEDFGLTIVRATGLPLSEVVRIAEGLY